ncbi:DUF6796 family protein [Polaribacter staleyi]|uniref:DUF6796 family protein n=1 Tax=Polaribacter staleyi TaxID=2022337 RepID=UPI0031BB4C17
MKLTKILGYLGFLASIIVGLGEYLLHYSTNILENANEYEFFKFVSLDNLTTGHFLAVIGLPFYFAGYVHIYRMLKYGNDTLAKAVLALGFIAFAVGGVWIGSRASIGNIVHLKDTMTPATYQNLLEHYTNHMEILVQALRVVIASLSIVFATAILKGGTYYKKWMAFFNPITILILLVIIGKLIPALGKHMLPILMNVTHFILFGISLYQLNKHSKINKNA